MYSAVESASFINKEGTMEEKMSRELNILTTVTVFAQKKQCVYCNSYVVQNLCVRCSLNFEFGTYNVIKCIFIFFNVNKVKQHVNSVGILGPFRQWYTDFGHI